jgi:hypothetical protein
MSRYSVSIPRCTHIKTNGTQCGSPALRGRRFCFFHKNWRGQRIQLNAQLPASPARSTPKPPSFSSTPYKPPRTNEHVVIDPNAVDETPVGENQWTEEDFEKESDEPDELEEDQDEDDQEEDRDEKVERIHAQNNPDLDPHDYGRMMLRYLGIPGYCPEEKQGCDDESGDQAIPPAPSPGVNLPDIRKKVQAIAADGLRDIGYDIPEKLPDLPPGFPRPAASERRCITCPSDKPNGHTKSS